MGTKLTALSGAIVLAIAVLCSTGTVPDSTPSEYTLISTATPPASPAIPLPPNDHGYVRVVTKSGSTACSINSELVACHASPNNWTTGTDGQHFHTASVNANGEFHWVNADLGELEGRVTLDYQTYSAQGWTIVAGPDGTKFTNDRSGHGMTVSVESVTSF